MWADSKTIWFLKFGSTVQKLFNVEIRRPTPFLLKNNVKRGNFEHGMTLESLKKFQKPNFFGFCPHAAGKILFLTILCI